MLDREGKLLFIDTAILAAVAIFSVVLAMLTPLGVIDTGIYAVGVGILSYCVIYFIKYICHVVDTKYYVECYKVKCFLEGVIKKFLGV